MIQCLGGSKLFAELMDKNVNEADITHVYDYLRLDVNFDPPRPFFFDVRSREAFDDKYKIEHSRQLQAMQGDSERVQSCIFANELLELYELVYKVLRSRPDEAMYVAAACCLPY